MEKLVTVFERKSKKGGNYYSGTLKGKWLNVFKGQTKQGKSCLNIQSDTNQNIGKLFPNTSKSGRVYYTGYFGDYANKVTAFINVSKDGTKKYITIYKSEPMNAKEEPKKEVENYVVDF